MCGIAGIFSYNASAPDPDPRELLAIRDAMTSRGPDGAGVWTDPSRRVILAHRRLAIIDTTDASAQPMATPDGQTVISFNGEIYNYRELRTELQAHGVKLRTAGDTEVLLHLYMIHREAMLDKLEGMFALAIWDQRANRLVLARDPHGIKPLYYAIQAGTVRFASSVRALMIGGALSRDPDPASAVGYLAWGSVPEPRTIYRSIRALPAGAHAGVDERGMDGPRRYWSPAGVYARQTPHLPVLSRMELDDLVRREVRGSVEKHLVADVPVGVFLSAGYDSCAVLALAAELHSGPVRAVTLQFQEFRNTEQDEAAVAARAARCYGADHVAVSLGFEDVRRGMPAFLRAMDQPTNDGLNIYWVSHAVSQIGLKAAMSGLGGDELLGGYSSFHRYRMMRRCKALGGLGRASGLGHKLSALLPGWKHSAKAAAALAALQSPERTYHAIRGVFMLDEVRRHVAESVWQEAGGERCVLEPVTEALSPIPRETWSQLAVAEQSLYMRNQLLRDADWASMAHSLEVRVPLVDRRLTERLGTSIAAQKGRYGKAPLAASTRPALPRFVTSRRKTGFALPMNRWVLDVLRKGDMPLPPRWLLRDDPQAVAKRMENALSADHIHWSKPWQLLVLGSYFS